MADTLSPDPREGKLPAWARELLARERRARKDAEALALRATLATRPSESAAILDRFDDHPIGLGREPRIAFRVPFAGFHPEDSFIEVRQLGDRPGINLHATGEIVVRTSSINSLNVVPWPGRRG